MVFHPPYPTLLVPLSLRHAISPPPVLPRSPIDIFVGAMACLALRDAPSTSRGIGRPIPYQMSRSHAMVFAVGDGFHTLPSNVTLGIPFINESFPCKNRTCVLLFVEMPDLRPRTLTTNQFLQWKCVLVLSKNGVNSVNTLGELTGKNDHSLCRRRGLKLRIATPANLINQPRIH